MAVTIQLNDKLASRLEVRASAENANLEEFTQILLARVLDQLEASERWGHQNKRRLELIEKSFQGCLSPNEERELEQLQAAADQWLAPVDRQLLDFATRLEDAARQCQEE
jgi:hypothetical protein